MMQARGDDGRIFGDRDASENQAALVDIVSENEKTDASLMFELGEVVSVVILPPM